MNRKTRLEFLWSLILLQRRQLWRWRRWWRRRRKVANFLLSGAWVSVSHISSCFYIHPFTGERQRRRRRRLARHGKCGAFTLITLSRKTRSNFTEQPAEPEYPLLPKISFAEKNNNQLGDATTTTGGSTSAAAPTTCLPRLVLCVWFGWLLWSSRLKRK